MAGLAATGGGLGGSESTDGLDIWAKEGLGEFISGFRDFAGKGDGVRALLGIGDVDHF